MLTALQELDPDDTEKASAIADALKYEMPDVWSKDFLTLLNSGDRKIAPILARAFGYRRVQCGPELMSAMKRCTAPALVELIWAVGRIGYEPARELLLEYLNTGDEPARAAAALALVRLGEPRAIDYCLDQATSNTWPALPLGLAGRHRALTQLNELVRKDGSPDYLTALGLLGDPVSVPLLISSLEQPHVVAAAVTALQCITGAGLYETVFIPEEVDEDELSDSEREQLKQGKALDRGDGRPFGSTVTRLSQSPNDWHDWWQTNGSRFTLGMRYRNGGLFSPARLVETLAAENTPHELRRYCSEELTTRYCKDFGLETDMPVARQITLLSEAAAWTTSCQKQFQEGEWYFAGKLA